MLKEPIETFRKTGIAEAISYLVLVGIAMPLKYLADMPMAVRIVGSLHGFLFILYCLTLAVATLKARWTLARAGFFFVISLLPFGPFLVDGKLRGCQEEYKRMQAGS